MRIHRKRVFLAFLVAGVVLSLILTVRHLFGPRVLAHAVAPNGVEFAVVQRFSFEPFNTSAYYRKPDGPWGWFYFDHQDWYWPKSKCAVSISGPIIYIRREGELVIAFDSEREEFSRFNGRTIAGAQSWHPEIRKLADLPLP